jgi:hypothetical protein
MTADLGVMKMDVKGFDNKAKRDLLGLDGEDEVERRLKLTKELVASNRKRADLEDRLGKMDILDFEDPELLAILNQLKVS